MSKTHFVLSTMTSSVAYAFFDCTKRDQPIERGRVLIRGGASIPSNKSGIGERSEDLNQQPIWTAAGFVTPVEDAVFQKLKEHPVFKKHISKNLLRVLSSDISNNHKDISRATRDMSMDGFRQLNKETLAQKIKVTTKLMDSEQQYRI